jgi:hypothetical protein
MTLREATIIQGLLVNTEVAALVGDRIYPGALPGNPTLPAVTYQLVSSPRGMTQSGASWTRPRYRWNCFALTYDEAVTVSIAVARAAGPTFNGWVDDESDHRETNTGLFRRRLETLAYFDAPEATP